MSEAALSDLVDAARRPGARPLAASLLPAPRLAEGLARVERLLQAAARQAPDEPGAAARMLLDAGGKRLRPLLTLLSARAAACGGRARGRVALAVSAELLHAATLLHDDVLDDGLTRRGQPAPRVLYGNAVSVLAGDWLLTKALELALRSRVPGAPALLVQTLRRLVEGEALQLRLRGDASFSPGDALRVARLKTGALFGFCGEAGAATARAPEHIRAALRTFGERCGVAFQIADDLLDLEGDARTLGKAVLADVTEGKASLPVALALEAEPRLRGELRALLDARLEAGEADAGQGRARLLAERIARTGALAAARRIAERERDLAVAALEVLAPSGATGLLCRLGGALLDRTH